MITNDVIGLATGSEPISQVYQSFHVLFLCYGSHGRYYRFSRLLKLFLDTFSLSL